MEFEERPISSKTVFHGHLIDVEVQQVITPHGNKTQREIVHHAPAIAILALTADNKMILEKQWRAPIAKTTLEIPAGKLDQRDADNALHAAKRELNEETRYEATSLKKISSSYRFSFTVFSSKGIYSKYLYAIPRHTGATNQELGCKCFRAYHFPINRQKLLPHLFI